MYGLLERRLRTVWALVIREAQAMRGDKRWGYLRLYVDPLLFLGCFMLIRPLLQGRFSLDVLQPGMLIAGFSLFFMFKSILQKGIGLGRPAGSLFHFRQVTVIDLFLAWAVIYWNLYISFFVALLALFYGLGRVFDFTHWFYLAFGACSMLIFALGSCMVAWNLLARFPSLGWIADAFNRVLFWVSGIFFSPASMPHAMQNKMAWNPISQCIEMARHGTGSPTSPLFLDCRYVSICAAAMLFLGLLLSRQTERMLRK